MSDEKQQTEQALEVNQFQDKLRELAEQNTAVRVALDLMIASFWQQCISTVVVDSALAADADVTEEDHSRFHHMLCNTLEQAVLSRFSSAHDNPSSPDMLQEVVHACDLMFDRDLQAACAGFFAVTFPGVRQEIMSKHFPEAIQTEPTEENNGSDDSSALDS